MEDLSIDLRWRIVEAYLSKRSGTYAQTAALFGVGEASVSRLLKLHRETGDVKAKPRGGNNPRRVDLTWLRAHLEQFPDARITDRVEDWVRSGGRRVNISTMWLGIVARGWSHKKRRWSRASETAPTSSPSASSSAKRSRR